jgi:hypothetical protein
VLEASETAAGELALAPAVLAPAELAEPEPLRQRTRRVAAQVGQAATGFVLLLFEILLRRDGRDRASR